MCGFRIIVAVSGAIALAGCSSSGSGGLGGILGSSSADVPATQSASLPQPAAGAPAAVPGPATAGQTTAPGQPGQASTQPGASQQANATAQRPRGTTSFTTGRTPDAPVVQPTLVAAQPAVPVATAVEAPVDPMAKPMHVGWTMARARHCGFYFEPDKVRAGYLAFEARNGTPPEQLSKIEQTVRFTEVSVAKRLPEAPAYCTDAVLGEIRADLPPMVAGDFTRPPRAPKKNDEEEAGLLSWLSTPVSNKPKPFDRRKVFAPGDSK
ncbi:MAG: hypothetical protein GC150_09300 [Rhizobiales bacterium]|nr:hypothetical protein [Hyphomicrobiales bacterium]